MNSDQLIKFKTIVECGTLSKAAEKLYISQPALSYTIAALERETECQLSTRDKNKLILTADGQRLLEYAMQISDVLSRATQAMPNAALERDKARFGKKLVITGGWDRRGPGSVENVPEEVVRQSVHTAIDTYGRDGGLIFWDGGIIGDSADAVKKRTWVYDEVRKYGSQVYRA